MSFFDLVFIALILYLGHATVGRVVKSYNVQEDRILLIRLFYYHIFFSLLFGWYVTSFGGDAIGYWRPPTRFVSWMDLHVTGTAYIKFIAYPFSQVLGLSFWTGTLLFSLFGFWGFVFIYLTFKRHITNVPTIFGFELFPLVLFLPNMHFWSAGIGKDSVIFFALALFIFSMSNPARNMIGLAISFYLAYFIRPHISLLMVVGMVFGLLVSTKGVSFFWRLVFLGVGVYAFVLISPAVFEYIGLDEENIEGIGEIAKRKSINVVWHTVGSAIDISTYSVSLKIITFFFRPFFYDAGNIFGYIVSIENAFYALLIFSAIRIRHLIEIVRMPMHLNTGLFVAGSTAFFMSSTLGNLGIIIRQKNMVMFMLVMIALHLIGRAQERQVALPRRTRPRLVHAKAEAA